MTDQVEEPETVDHPAHYNSHPSGVETVAVAEAMNFNIGHAFKYVMRAFEKGDPVENVKKAQWFIDRELERRQHPKVYVPNQDDWMLTVISPLVNKIATEEENELFAKVYRALWQASIRDGLEALADAKVLVAHILQEDILLPTEG